MQKLKSLVALSDSSNSSAAVSCSDVVIVSTVGVVVSDEIEGSCVGGAGVKRTGIGGAGVWTIGDGGVGGAGVRDMDAGGAGV